MSEPDLTAEFNRHTEGPGGGFNKLIGLRFTEVRPSQVRATIPVTPELLQPYGLVHGGLYCTIGETLCSCGAAIQPKIEGRSVVGLDNSSSFLHAVRDGALHATATPITVGRRTQLWRCEIRNDQGRLVATSQVRLLCLDPNTNVSGGNLKVSQGDDPAPK